MTRDWVAWHRDYEDPSSSLSHRRAVVIELIRLALDRAPKGTIRVLSLCCGDAFDLAETVRDHPRRNDLRVVAVELDPELAERARANVASAGMVVDVRCADAGTTAVFADLLPVDILLLVGIFGNISDQHIEDTITAVPSMCATYASVIWTRHRRLPDVTPNIRKWFDNAGCVSQRFESPGEGKYAVGLDEFVGDRRTALPEQLFVFSNDLW